MAINPSLVSIKKVEDIPTVPLSELATGQMFGYTGGGDLKKVATSDLLDFVKSDIKGIATQTNAPTPYDAVTYPDGLFERWEVVEPITTSSTWYTFADAATKLLFPITAPQLADNYFYFHVTNGVVTLDSKPNKKGKDAYQSYLDTTLDSPKKTEVQWSESLKDFKKINFTTNVLSFREDNYFPLTVLDNYTEFTADFTGAKFGKTKVLKLTGASIGFSTDFIIDENSDDYDAIIGNIIYIWYEFGKAKVIIKNSDLSDEPDLLSIYKALFNVPNQNASTYVPEIGSPIVPLSTASFNITEKRLTVSVLDAGNVGFFKVNFSKRINALTIPVIYSNFFYIGINEDIWRFKFTRGGELLKSAVGQVGSFPVIVHFGSPKIIQVIKNGSLVEIWFDGNKLYEEPCGDILNVLLGWADVSIDNKITKIIAV